MTKKVIKVILFLFIILSLSIQGKNITQACEENDEFVICIDPGHQKKGDSRGEPVSPSSGNMKARVSSGTAGVATKKAEYIVNLEASLKLKNILEDNNLKVVMTRESHDVNISNAERAEISNKANADMTVRIHCDGSDNGGKSGASILVPSKANKVTAGIYEESFKYATLLKEELMRKGVKVNGIFERNDITGFNWSRVPVVIFEMGFMSNYNEDKMLSDDTYQEKLMQSVADALKKYKEN